LSDAIEMGHYVIVKLLVEAGADLLPLMDNMLDLGNPVTISCAAMGLEDAANAKYVSPAQLIMFLQTPGSAPCYILKAIFDHRTLRYYNPQSKKKVEVKTAFLPSDGMVVYEGPENPDRLMEQDNQDYEDSFLFQLAPQQMDQSYRIIKHKKRRVSLLHPQLCAESACRDPPMCHSQHPH